MTFEEGKPLLDEAIKLHKGTNGALMPVLHVAQNIFGAVSLDTQRYISVKMHIPLSDIYGVITFYAQFTMIPNGRYLINSCMGTACYIKGAQFIIDKLSRELDLPINSTSADGKFTLRDTRCIGACGLAPVIVIDGDVYGRLEESEITNILKKYQNKE